MAEFAGGVEQVREYFRVVVTYSNDETSSNRVFKDREKAEKWAVRQKRSRLVKKAEVESFVRNRQAWRSRRAA